jgi:hypothetical protein
LSKHEKENNSMSKKAAEHHEKASEHLTHAALLQPTGTDAISTRWLFVHSRISNLL